MLSNMKGKTKALLLAIISGIGILQSTTVQHFLTPYIGAHPGLAALLVGLGSIYTLLHDPKVRDVLGLPAEDTDSKSASQSGFARLGILLLLSVVAGVMLLGAWSCNNWEQTTFQALSADKGVIDCSVAAYNHDAAATQKYCADPTMTIAQTSANRTLIDKGRQAHDGAVMAFREYWCVAHPSKPANSALGLGPCTSLAPGETTSADQVTAAQQKVLIALQGLPELIAQIKAIANK